MNKSQLVSLWDSFTASSITPFLVFVFLFFPQKIAFEKITNIAHNKNTKVFVLFTVGCHKNMNYWRLLSNHKEINITF
jgi:hypothetical protein